MSRIDLLARSEQKASIEVADKANISDDTTNKDTLVKDDSLGDLLHGRLTNIALPAKPVGTLKLFFNDNTMEDLWILLTWKGNDTD